MLRVEEPGNCRIKVGQCFDQSGVPIGEKPECSDVRVVARTATIGPTLFANAAMQKTIAQEGRQY